MGFPLILVVILASIFCLAPLSIYFLRLAFVTRRERPTVIAGQWDFVGLVAGLSGFLLFGGGLVLSLFQSNFRYWMRGNFESLRAAWGQEKVTWILLGLAYFLAVVGWIAVTLLSRRRSLVVYNVEPAVIESAIGEILEQLNRPVERRGNVWGSGEPLLEVDRFIAGRTVTIRWVSDDRRLFQDVERLLREAVRNIASDDNPSSRWLMACSVGAGMASLCGFGLILYAIYLAR